MMYMDNGIVISREEMINEIVTCDQIPKEKIVFLEELDPYELCFEYHLVTGNHARFDPEKDRFYFESIG